MLKTQLDYQIKEKGETFHWGGVYSDDFSTRDTLFTKLGVFENFQPKITNSSFDAPILFLANIQPSLQNDVINNSPIDFKLCLDVDHGDLSSNDIKDTDPYAWIDELCRFNIKNSYL